MSVILILILASLAVAWAFLAGFIWAVKSGQFEDTCTPAMRILSEDEAGKPGPPQTAEATHVGACRSGSPEVGRVSPSAPRGAEAVRNVRVRATADGALGETRPTSTGVDDLGNTPLRRLLCLLDFTLQFIPPEQRLELIQRIHAGLRPDGILILSEKIAFSEPWRQHFHEELHHDFKRANGYSDLEISQKRSALEKVLIPETLACHQERLRAAGFSSSELWFQCFNFVSLVAIK
jgi:cbb3-type cytochrome oxidase maturation protein